MEAVSDFIKNAGLFTFVHLLVALTLVVSTIVWFLTARARPANWRWLLIGIVPALSGILLWYLRNRSLDTAIRLQSDLIPEDVSGIRWEARVNLLVGLAATTVILILRFWRQPSNRKSA